MMQNTVGHDEVGSTVKLRKPRIFNCNRAEFAERTVASGSPLDIFRVDIKADILPAWNVVEDLARPAPNVNDQIAITRPDMDAHISAVEMLVPDERLPRTVDARKFKQAPRS